MPLTAERPKVLVEVAGQNLLAGLISTCERLAMARIVIVTGYRHQDIEDWLAEHPPSLPVATVFNPAYDQLGNAWSVYVARAELAGADFVKLDGDLVLDRTIIEGLVTSPWRSAIALDTRGQLDAEAMKAVVDDEGRVQGMGKWLPLTESSGESIGVERIGAEDGARLFATIETLVQKEGKGDAYYEDAYHVMLQAGWELGAYDIGSSKWTEIDDARDLERARALDVNRGEA
jgi:choline kinase